MANITIPDYTNPGRRDPYVPSPFFPSAPLAPGGRGNTNAPITTNHSVFYDFDMKTFVEPTWNKALTSNMFAFVIRGKYSSYVARNTAGFRKSQVLATLPIVNYMLASRAGEVKTVEDVYDAIAPLGVVVTREPENRTSYSRPEAKLNLVVKGSANGTYNLWGGLKSAPPGSRVYFLIKKVKILPEETLRYSLGLDGSCLKSVAGGAVGKTVFQIVPYLSFSDQPPRVVGSTEGSWYVGRIAKPTKRRMIEASEDNDTEKLSRSTESICRSTRVELFLK